MAQQVKDNRGPFEYWGWIWSCNGKACLTWWTKCSTCRNWKQEKWTPADPWGYHQLPAVYRWIVSPLAESQHKANALSSDVDSLHTKYDPEKLRQIIANLLSNAVKFTPEPETSYVGHAAGNTGPRRPRFHWSLKWRTGIGIPESHLEKIFDRFYQLDNGHTRKTEGTESDRLTRELVKLMDGDITVKSPPAGSNKGTEFSVTLPLIKWFPVDEQSHFSGN